MTIEKHNFYVLPIPPDCCQVCGQKHPEKEPHDPTTLRYRMLFAANHPQGKSPTWEDAMVHCDEDVKERWKKFLIKIMGIDPNSPDVLGGMTTQEEFDRRLRNE